MRSTRRLATLAVCGLTLGALGIGAVGLGATASAVAPSQVVLAFDDLGPSTIGTHMVDGYGGFSWNNTDWYSMSLSATSTNTFLALSGKATSIRRTDGADFTFDGLDVWSRRGLDANGDFWFVLSRDGVTVYDGRNDPNGRQRFVGTSTTFTANYPGTVDSVAIVFGGNQTDWDQTALDNFRYTPVDPAATTTTAAPVTTVAPAPAPAPAPGTVTTYKLTVRTNGKGSVAASRTGNTFVAGQVITLTATPAAGATWTGWTGDVTSSSLSITFTVTKNMTITANFK